MAKLTSRIFFLMQYEKHPHTGEQLWSREQIEQGLDHKTIKEWAWVYHDKDVWTEEDELEDSTHTAGEPKPPHFHVAISLPKNATDIEVIAKWFGIPMNFIEVKRGAGAFLDCVEYLTHEHPNQQLKGKTLYPDEEIISNFDWRKSLDDRNLSRAKYGQALDRKTMIRMAVLQGEMSVREVKRKYPLIYMNDKEKLEKLRMEYIKDATPPKQRFNYYICGDGDIGKGSASICLARSLYPELENDDDIFFVVGAKTATFEKYDGQPVIIWEDCRSYELKDKLGSRGNIFAVFERFPKKQQQNVKFGSVNLINEVNIVNSVQPYEDFLNDLVDEYVDKEGVQHKAEMDQKQQSYRRFPFIMPLRADDFDILVNRAFLTGSKNPQDYINYVKYEGIRGNFAKLLQANPDRVSVVDISTRMVRPAIEAQKAKQTALEEKVFDASEFAEYGTVPEPVVVEEPTPEEIDIKKQREQEAHDDYVMSTVLLLHNLSPEQFLEYHEAALNMTEEQIENERVNGDSNYWWVYKCHPSFAKTAYRWRQKRVELGMVKEPVEQTKEKPKTDELANQITVDEWLNSSEEQDE